MANLKSLAKDTAIYGGSSIIGKFLNYLLFPMHVSAIPAATGGYGEITNIYAITALFVVLLTCGMETGFFRFANKQEENPGTVYSSVLIVVGVNALVFVLLCFSFLDPIASFLGYAKNPEFIGIMAIVIGLDAFQSVPFAYLRYKNRPIKFATIRVAFILLSILLNYFFLKWCPWLNDNYPETISWFYNPNYQVGYVFIANLICSLLQMVVLSTELRGFPFKFDPNLIKRMFRYSFPILVLGIVGIFNQTADKILFPLVYNGSDTEAKVQLGIYGAGSKIAMIMAMFTQAFRYAYEPFVFGKEREGDNRKLYAQSMKFFIIFALIGFLAVTFYLDLLRYMVNPDYWDGLRVVPIVMVAEIFMGVYFNLSFWYKLIDETKWGAYFSFIGCAIIVLLNVIFVPIYGYMACAWAGLIGYFIIMVISYLMGQKKYPINYDLKSIMFYVILAACLYVIYLFISPDNMILRLGFRTILLVIFIAFVVKKDLPLKEIPIINRFIKK